jgi:hypothetical protein
MMEPNMLTPKDWKSLRFSQTRTALVAEWLMAAAAVLYALMGVSFFKAAGDIAAVRHTTLTEIVRTAWDGLSPLQSYPGTFVMAIEPLALGAICMVIGTMIAAMFWLMVSMRRRNRRFLVFLDRYQSSFDGTLPEDEDIDRLIETV